MDIQNPFRHFPRYSIQVALKNGEQFYKRGSAQPVVNIPAAEEDVVVMVLTALDAGSNACNSRMWVDGIWAKYSEAEVERLLNPPVPEPEPEEVEVEVDEKAEVTDEVSYEIERTVEENEDKDDEEDYGNEYGLGCG